MPVRIEKIKINRSGPLRQDFVFEPGDFNLIYGPNETGKSYLVEAIINLLFKPGARGGVDWKLRDWDFTGSVKVAGVGEGLETFTKSGKKRLEDYWPESAGLPQDFSKLLVVKEGESLLFGHGDVGRTFLKNYLSGEGLLDDIQGRISATLQKADVADGKITGNHQGEIKQLREVLEKRNELEKLLSRAQTQYASGTLKELQAERQVLKDGIEGLEKAKRHRAWFLSEEIQKLEKEIASLPDQADFPWLDGETSIYANKKSEMEGRRTEAQKLGGNAEKYNWVCKAREVYLEYAGKTAAKPNPFLFWLAIVLLVGGVVSGIFGFQPGLIAGGVLAALLLVLYFIKARQAINTAGSSRELELIKAEYRQRFNSEFAGRATLEMAVEQLGKEVNRLESLQEEIRKNELSLNEKAGGINARLYRYCGKNILPEEWAGVIGRLRQELRDKNHAIKLLEDELTGLSVSREQFQADDPGIEWAPERHRELLEKVEQLDRDIKDEENSLESLRRQVSAATNCDSGDFGELFTRLQDIYEEKNTEFLQKTAEILAKITVNQVVEELKLEEDERIAEGLASPELTVPLYDITRHYRSMMYDTAEGLVLATEEGEQYPLKMLSTGAREQVFLALRMGFARIAMSGQSAFMILDDAFQHSDWRRRSNLVERVAELAASNWQIFYFTMDDHIRDLIKKAGSRFEEGFKYIKME